MYREVSKLILYREVAKDSVLSELCGLFEAFDKRSKDENEIISGIYGQIKRILDISTDYGFDKNLWHNYLTFEILNNENSFSLTCEGVGAHEDGSVNEFAKNDFRIFKNLFDFDFSKIENALKINCFSTITHYHAISKTQKLYNRDVSEAVRQVSEKIENVKDENGIFDIVCDFYKRRGVGLFGINRAFRISGSGKTLELVPINNADSVRFSDLVGYEKQKQELKLNTESFCRGGRANNVLLYGDSGTGKSTSVKALLNEYYDMGLRMIEIYKYQFRDLSNVIAKVKKRNHKFIIFIDDLSFEEDEVEYKFLKAVIEGGVESRPDNVLIYATSNRRHLIKETWSDRNDMEYNDEIHRSDTVEEKLSLSSRFGITINYSIPKREEFFEIVSTLSEREGIKTEKEQLFAEAARWELRHGGLSGRCARQFVDYLKSREKNI
ncbi:MAG: ATP-binding protein [Clostridiales bacterium]|nr:ATP-binding protein [Clostridiales bacterium]